MNTSDLRFSTAEMAELAGVSPRQLQLWDERRVGVASRTGRIRSYTSSQALLVMLLADLRRRGFSFQRLHRLSDKLRRQLENHGIDGKPRSHGAFILTDGREVQFADSRDKMAELALNFRLSSVQIDLGKFIDRLEKQGLAALTLAVVE